MKIALIAFHFAEYAYRLALELAREHKVLLIMHEENAFQELGDSLCEDQPMGLEIDLFSRRGPKDPLFILNVCRLVRLLRRFGPNVIHYQESLNYAFSIAINLFRDIPVVLTVHDHIVHSGVVETRLMTHHRRFLRKRPDAVIVHGARIREESEEIMPWLKGRIFSIPHGPLGEITDGATRDWENGTLLFFGRIEKYKGLGYLIEATRILTARGIPVKVVIAGRGGELEKYRASILANTCFELIDRFIDRKDVRSLFERANIVVLPYTDATQSGVVSLALRFARPVIASDVGSIGEVVRNGFNGILVPPGDANALADAIERLVIDAELSRVMGDNARRLAENELSWTSIAQESIKVYLLASQRRKQKGKEI